MACAEIYNKMECGSSAISLHVLIVEITEKKVKYIEMFEIFNEEK